MRDDPVDNYLDVVRDFIRLHEKGDESVFNVTGLLFYLRADAHTRTCDDVLQAIQRVTSCKYISEIKTLMR